MISSISLSNFRGVKIGKIDGLTDINVLIGANGAGKSTLLEAIYLASAWVESSDQIRNRTKFDVITYRRTQRGDWNNLRNFLWYEMDTTKDIGISLSFRSGKAMEFKIPYKTYGSLPLASEKMIFLNVDGNYVNPDGNEINEKNVVTRTISTQGVYDKFNEEIRFLRETTLIDNMVYSNLDFIERNVWPKVYSKRLDKILIELLKEGYEPDADSLTYVPVAPGLYALMVGFSRTAARVDDLGDGARVSLVVASILSTVNHSVALVEDPEVHQHPAGLEKLLNFILKTTKNNGIQLFVTTQSLDLLRVLLSIYPSNCKVFALRRNQEGTLEYRQFTLDEVEDLFESKVDIRKITEELQLETR
ncbi:MAG: AAA family ATPase [Thermoproteota archaeon]